MKRDTYEMMASLERLGFSYAEAQALRRISMTLRRWFEMECGTDHGCIERDEESGKAYLSNAMSGHRSPVADKETGARKRLAAIMAAYKRRLLAYVQTDCRGAALYILRKADVRGQDVASIYDRGVAVY